MRGHEQLIAMRRKRLKPAMVFVWCGEDDLKSWADWHAYMPHMPQIEVSDDETLAGLDMRFVVGLSVLVQGLSRRRIMAVYERCVECSAKRVWAAVTDDSGHEVEFIDSMGTVSA